MTSRLDPGHPAAQRIERRDDQKPYRVDTRQPDPVSAWEKETERQETARLEALKDAKCNSERVYQVKVGHIECEGGAAEDDQRSADGAGRSEEHTSELQSR